MKSNRWRLAVTGALILASSSFAASAQEPGEKAGLAFAAIYARESRDNGPETVKGYTAAARSGSCQAAKRLGEIYDRALSGISQDYAESLKWYHAAHGLGCDVPGVAARAASSFAVPGEFAAIYARETRDSGRDTVKAYISAARSGSCQAAKRLGEIYDRGLLWISRDVAESLKWYNFSRTLGCGVPDAKPATTQPTPSSWTFGTALALEAEGKGPQAVEAYKYAARSGNCDAARRLGDIYDKGLIGISRNYEESLKWYHAARIMGCEVFVKVN